MTPKEQLLEALRLAIPHDIDYVSAKIVLSARSFTLDRPQVELLTRRDGPLESFMLHEPICLPEDYYALSSQRLKDWKITISTRKFA